MTVDLAAGLQHHVPDQLNVFVLDMNSDCTGFGTHQRLVGPFRGTGSDRHLVTLREDLLYDLPESTEEQRAAVLNGWGRIHPVGTRLVHVDSERYTHNYPAPGTVSCEHIYRIERPVSVMG